MSIVAVGINHKTAPVAIREKISFNPDKLSMALQEMLSHVKCKEAAILSTCNRTELYLVASEKYDITQAKVINWLEQHHNVPASTIIPSLYWHSDQQAVNHMMRVACGLDSLVLGEPQILGQMKQAYSQAKAAGSMALVMDRLFQRSFGVAKQVRTETEIGASAVSVAFAAVNLAKHIFASLEKAKVLLVGAGETIELVAKHLYENKVGHITVANRTLTRAEGMAKQVGADVITLAQIPQHMADADIVISSTGSTLPLIGKGMVEQALAQRKHRPVFMVDLAVPRDIEEQVSDLEDVFLYTVDDLQQVITENMNKRESTVESAERIINAEAELFAQWQKRQRHHDLLKQFQQRVTAEKEQLLAKHLPKDLSEHHQQKIETMAHQLSKKHSHHSITALRKVIESGNEEHIKLMAEVFDLSIKNIKK